MSFLIDFLTAMIVALACYMMMSYTAHADISVQLLGPIALTQHVLNDNNAAHRYTNRVSKDGSLIANPEIGVIITDTSKDYYESYGIFGGQNSVGGLMGGGLFEFGTVYGHWQIGGALGSYLQDDCEFNRRIISPFELGRSHNIGLAPVIGVAVNYKIQLSKKTYLQLNNILSPIITNTVLSVGFQW